MSNDILHIIFAPGAYWMILRGPRDASARQDEVPRETKRARQDSVRQRRPGEVGGGDDARRDRSGDAANCRIVAAQSAGAAGRVYPVDLVEPRRSRLRASESRARSWPVCCSSAARAASAVIPPRRLERSDLEWNHQTLRVSFPRKRESIIVGRRSGNMDARFRGHDTDLGSTKIQIALAATIARSRSPR